MIYNNMTKADYNKLQGKKSKAEGEYFENLIEASCLYYEEHKKAYIEKTPEPFKVLGKEYQGNRQIFKGVFERKGQPDFKGTLAGGISVCFEAKHTDKDRIEKDRLTAEQQRSLDLHRSLGAITFVLVSFKLEDFYLIPWWRWREMKELYGRKYIKQEEMEQYRCKYNYSVIKFIEKMEELKTNDNFY